MACELLQAGIDAALIARVEQLEAEVARIAGLEMYIAQLEMFRDYVLNMGNAALAVARHMRVLPLADGV